MAEKVALPFAEAFLRGIGANWFVCLVDLAQLVKRIQYGANARPMDAGDERCGYGFLSILSPTCFLFHRNVPGASVTVGRFYSTT